MADRTSIEWTDATWNPIVGCSVLSPGCTNCYAMRLAGTRLMHHPSRAGLTTETKAGPVWTGETRLDERTLLQPLRWRRPRKIFVCAHSDLFHEATPDAWIDRIFAIMVLCPQHTFQVLTKRPERMRDYIESISAAGIWGRQTEVRAWVRELSEPTNTVASAEAVYRVSGARQTGTWRPLPNVWLGVTAERQQESDIRIPILRSTPADKRFISVEPMLGHVTLDLDGIDWVIVGGESGPNARPMHPDWVRAIRDQCAAAGVPFLFKQWGEWAPRRNAKRSDLVDARSTLILSPDGRKTSGLMDYPADAWIVDRVGKRAAGRTLDGVEHTEFPKEAAPCPAA